MFPFRKTKIIYSNFNLVFRCTKHSASYWIEHKKITKHSAGYWIEHKETTKHRRPTIATLFNQIVLIIILK